LASGDIYYSPAKSWPAELIAEIQPSQILLIGQPPAEVVIMARETGVEVKHYEPSRIGQIPPGSTFFRNLSRSDGWKLIHNFLGTTQRSPVSAERQQNLENEDPLIYVTETFDFHWGNANYFGENAKFQIGDSVQIINDGDNRVGKIEKIQFVSGEVRYGILTNSGLVHLFEEALEILHSTPGDPLTWIKQRPSNAETIALTLTATKLKDPLTDIIYSFQTSRTLFRPYQFKPVLKMLTGASQRILIADEVGLGKTIEAGLIWSELEFRSPLENVLVLCPAVLKKKWQNEMLNRFDRKLVELNKELLGDWLNAYEKGRAEPLCAVATLESLRSSPHLDQMRDLAPSFDLVIVDEAHYLRNEGNKSHQLGQDLSDWAEYMIFLSATPLNLRADDLFNLLNLLDSAQFFDKQVFEAQLEPNRHLNNIARELTRPGVNPRKLIPELEKIKETSIGSSIAARNDYKRLAEILDTESMTPSEISQSKRHLAALNTLASVFTRTRKAETPEDRAIREPVPVIVNWSPLELAFYTAIRKWFVNRAMVNGHVPGFALQMPLRQAASCLPAMIEYMKSKYDFKEDEEDPFDFGSDLDPELSGILMDELVNNMQKIPNFEYDTKYEVFEEALLNVLGKVGKQVLIFSFFKRTIDYLKMRLLKKGIRVEIMYGNTPADKRYEIMERFRKGEFEILICSEVGSEGLDFEFCNILVNYDLPWNPMRVEQRIGRLDRFGQKAEKIFILNVQIPGTIEDDIFMRLYDRIELFQNSIGHLEPILRDEMKDLTSTLLDPKLSSAQVEAEILRKSIAWETRASELNDLSTHQNLVAGIDAFLIEGFDEHTPGRGRFIGKQEIQRVVGRYLAKFNGSISQVSANRFEIIGSEEISQQMRKLGLSRNKGTRVGVANLARDLDGRSPGLIVTFDAEVAANESLELVSVHHPLLEVVQSDLGSSELLLSKFGTLKLPAQHEVNPSLVGIYLARSRGIRPKLELWSATVNLETFELEKGTGDALLQSLAEGNFENSDYDFATAELKRASQKIENYIAAKHKSEREILNLDNAAIASERLAARKLSLENKINLTQGTLSLVKSDNRAQKIINIYQSRIDRLNRELSDLINFPPEIGAELELEAVAYVLVSN
jgi:superfamily II DNA or RNA helicase